MGMRDDRYGYDEYGEPDRRREYDRSEDAYGRIPHQRRPTDDSPRNYDEPPYEGRDRRHREPPYEGRDRPHREPPHDQPGRARDSSDFNGRPYDEAVHNDRRYDDRRYDEPIYDERRYDGPAYGGRGYDDQDYGRPRSRNHSYREPEYREPEYREPEYRERDYREPEYRDPGRRPAGHTPRENRDRYHRDEREYDRRDYPSQTYDQPRGGYAASPPRTYGSARPSGPTGQPSGLRGQHSGFSGRNAYAAAAPIPPQPIPPRSAPQPMMPQPMPEQLPRQVAWSPGPQASAAGPPPMPAIVTGASSPSGSSGAGRVFAGVFILVAVVCIGGFALKNHDTSTGTVNVASQTTAAADTTTAKAASGTLTFTVTGTGSAQLSWIDGNFQTSQETAALPWTKQVKAGTLPGVNMTAQRQSDDSGSITCEIRQDGKVIAHNTSSGTYAVVSCVVK